MYRGGDFGRGFLDQGGFPGRWRDETKIRGLGTEFHLLQGVVCILGQGWLRRKKA